MPNSARSSVFLYLVPAWLFACGSSVGGGPAGNTGGSAAGSSSGAAAGAGGSGAASTGAGSTAMGDAAVVGTQVWSAGTVISTDTTIGPGSVVTIQPGATVSVAAGVTLRIEGTLSGGAATGAHAVLAAASSAGGTWAGIVVASGATLDLTGVDLTGADTAIHVLAGALLARYDQGTITGASVPFSVDAGGELSTTGVTVAMPQGSSQVSGSFVASHLTYNSNGSEAIAAMDAAAKLSIEDSTFVGIGPVADMIVALGAASVHVAYSEITAAHCGFHFSPISAFDISYTNIHDNIFGFMLYGSSGPGPRTVTYSNVQNNSYAFDTSDANGPITFDHSYVTGTQNTGAGAVTETNVQAAAVPGTGPRGP